MSMKSVLSLNNARFIFLIWIVKTAVLIKFKSDSRPSFQPFHNRALIELLFSLIVRISIFPKSFFLNAPLPLYYHTFFHKT